MTDAFCTVLEARDPACARMRALPATTSACQVALA